MADRTPSHSPIVRIGVRLKIGSSLLAATDDPLFLGLRGPLGREFRLDLAHGRQLRRGGEDVFILAGPSDPETNVEHPELNDPRSPCLDAAQVTGAFLRKGFDPIPNVRAVAELDDRLEIAEAEVELHCEGRTHPLLFARKGPIWLGLVCGLSVELPRRADGETPS